MLRPSGLFISSFRHCSISRTAASSCSARLSRHSISHNSRRRLLVAAAAFLTTNSFAPLSVRAYSSFSGMSTFITERAGGGNCIITVSPKDESKQSALVVIAHGLGDTSEGFADVAEVRRLKVGRVRVCVFSASLFFSNYSLHLFSS
jgi:hypothetical protein